MKTERNIFIAFILNLGFSVFEFIGGLLTGSVAILSDAVHDIGDAASIGASYFLEKKSKKSPDETYTYGYARYSVVGSVITTLILLFGSGFVIYSAVTRIINPVEINYNGMILFAVVGVIVNFLAAFFTHGGESLNEKAVNLHMLEDVLGWLVVLIGAIVMRFTDIRIIDPIMSIAVALFIMVNALRGLKAALDIFLEKAPVDIALGEIREHITEIDGVIDVHHVHLWSMDEGKNYATMHVVAKGNISEIKKEIKSELREHGIEHSTLEFEEENEFCADTDCHPSTNSEHSHHHHHHH